MKNQILQIFLGVLAPVYAFGATVSTPMEFCDDGFVMHTSPTYNNLCEDYGSGARVADIKGYAAVKAMRHIWRRAKRQDRKAEFTDAFAHHLNSSSASPDQENASTTQDVKPRTKSIFSDPRYSLRANRNKVRIKVTFAF